MFNMDKFYPKNLFLPQFFILLWENPEIVAHMLMDSNPKDISKTLIPLIANNFYENILSSKYLQNILIYIIGLLLKNEINDLVEVDNPEVFLNNNSTCGYLLYELRNKTDSQIFIKKIIEEAVGKIDEYQSKICFDIKKINENISNQYLNIKHELIEKNNNKTFNISEKDIINNIIKKRCKFSKNKEKQINEFNKKYMVDINIEDDIEDDSNKEIKNYYNKSIIKRKNSFIEHINEFLNEQINECKYKDEILICYLYDFNIVCDFINTFLDNLINNMNIIPNSIKIICKTISLLITKKFPNISTINRNAFISRFFFSNLFYPVLQDTSFGALIDNYIIPTNTMNNLQEIIHIFIKFIMGKLFDKKEDNYLSPFNKFFIDQMSILIKFIDNLINVNLPKYLENIINDNNDYFFDVYKENEEDGFFRRAICFTVEDIQDIIIHVQKKINEIKNEKNKKFVGCFAKILDNSMGEVIFKIKKEEEKKNKLYYFLFTDELFLNNKIKKLFKSEQQNIFYQIKLINNPKNEEEKNKNLIIKVKNFIYAVLYKFINLSEEYLSIDSLNNVYDLFKDLLTKSEMPNYIIDNYIPTQWYLNSLLETLPKLPEEIKKNNCQNLIEDMIKEINLSIKEIDLETLTIIKSKLGKSSIQNPVNIINKIDLNKKVEKIINSEIIEVGLSFHFDKENTIFNIVQKKSILDFNVIDSDDTIVNVDTKESKTISEFIQNFPNLALYQLRQNVDILEFESRLHVPQQLSYYLKIINNHLKKTYNFSKEELSEILDKIYDYIMLKLYDKLYPEELLNDENKNFKNTIIYSWTESKHFIQKNNDSTFNSFLPDIIKYIKLFIKEKSPRKKIENVSNIFKAIEKVIIFNGVTGLLGADDFMAILSYAIVKAQPFRMPSNIKYTMLYDPKSVKGSEHYLTQLLGCCNFITELSFEKLFNITKEEFEEKMKQTIINY